MNNSDYLKLIEKSQRKKLRLTRKQERQIKDMYKQIYLNTSKKLSKANKDSLSEKYLRSVLKSLSNDILTIHSKIEKSISKNMLEMATTESNVQLNFLLSINDKFDLKLEDTFNSMFAKVPQSAVNEIMAGKLYKDRLGLSKRIWTYTKKFEKDIDYILAEGLAAKKSAYEIAKDLEIYLNPKAKKPMDWGKVYPKVNKTVDFNAQRLARTAINHTYQMAQKRSCERNPFVEKIQWVAAGIHGRTCEECKSRDGQIFKVKEVPLDHPNGICTTVPILEKELDQIGEELRNWIDGESNPKLDKWFNKYGKYQ